MSYYQDQADAAGRSMDNISLNGGMGSDAYWQASHSQSANQQLADAERRYAETSSEPSYNPKYETPSGTDGPSYVPNIIDPNEKFASLGGKLTFLMALFLGPFVGYQVMMSQIFEVRPNVSIFTQYSTGFNGSNPSIVSAASSRTIAKLEIHYSKLFKPNTPYERMIGPCSSGPGICADMSYEGFMRLQPYALNQGSYWNDICEINSRVTYSSFGKPTVEPEWFVSESKHKGSASDFSCLLLNENEIKAAQKAVEDKWIPIGMVIGGSIMLFGLVIMIRSRKKRGE